MKDISTLVTDIFGLIQNGTDKLTDEDYDNFGKNVAALLKRRLTEPSEEKPTFTLRMSNIGSPCVRKLYLEKNEHAEKEPLNGPTLLKFMYGDVIEEMLLFLAKASGHTVEGQQDEQSIAGIKGHRDCVIDGMLVDVKSASTFSFQKFEEGKLDQDDPFGYVVQGNSYLYAGQDDPLITNKDQFAFLVMDKTLGNVCLDIHQKKDWDLEKAYKQRIEILDGDALPERIEGSSVPEGKSGNMKLSTYCSYCDVKNVCYPELRTFLSSRGPLYLTEVKREPKMYEVGSNVEQDPDGTIITVDTD